MAQNAIPWHPSEPHYRTPYHYLLYTIPYHAIPCTSCRAPYQSNPLSPQEISSTTLDPAALIITSASLFENVATAAGKYYSVVIKFIFNIFIYLYSYNICSKLCRCFCYWWEKNIWGNIEKLERNHWRRRCLFKNVRKPGKALYGSIIWTWREEFSDNDGLTKAGFLVFRKVTGRRYTRVLGPRPPRQRCSGGEGKFTKTRETEFWWFTILNWNLRKKK